MPVNANTTVPNTPAVRALVVRAYAHAIMQDVLTDFALLGEPLPKSIGDLAGEDLGTLFEETFMQGHAPQWSYSTVGVNDVTVQFTNEVRSLVDKWLREVA